MGIKGSGRAFFTLSSHFSSAKVVQIEDNTKQNHTFLFLLLRCSLLSTQLK